MNCFRRQAESILEGKEGIDEEERVGAHEVSERQVIVLDDQTTS